jgi:hypothetical protein
MCWANYMAIPIVLKKPLRVYKVGTSRIFGNFISLFKGYVYRKGQTMPTVKINPVFIRHYHTIRLLSWQNDNFHIHKGYHSYLTKERAKCSRDDDVGIFEIPVGATIYVNYRFREVVSTDIRYLGKLEL